MAWCKVERDSGAISHFLIAPRRGPTANPVSGEVKNVLEEMTSKVKGKGHAEIIEERDLGEK